MDETHLLYCNIYTTLESPEQGVEYGVNKYSPLIRVKIEVCIVVDE